MLKCMNIRKPHFDTLTPQSDPDIFVADFAGLTENISAHAARPIGIILRNVR